MTFILILITIVLGVGLYFTIKSNITKSKKIDVLENIVLSDQQANEIRSEIENEYNQKENDIINADIITVGGMSDKKRHNHAFNQPCTRDCPAYTE